MSQLTPYLLQKHGHPCPFCKRPMDKDDFHLKPTRDHHPIPRSRGGVRTVVCCMLCNNRKGDMSAQEWETYMIENPQWWLVTRRERKEKRAAKREEARTEKWGPRGARVIRQAENPSTPMADALRGLNLARAISVGFDRKFRQT